MPLKSTLEPEFLDPKDKQILLLLQKNARESLTNIAKQVSLTIDSVHARIKKLQEKGIIVEVTVLLNPRTFGYPLIADVKIKLFNITEEETNRFLSYLTAHPKVVDLLTLMGDYDITCVLIAKNTEELEATSREIRQRFKGIIADWRAFLILKAYKFEKYALEG